MSLPVALELHQRLASVSQVAAQGRHDIGVRVALGAAAGDIVRLTAGVGLRPAVVGAAMGLPAAFAAAASMRGLLFRVPPFDLPSFAAASAVLLATAGLASWRSARRALRLDPLEALRAE